MPCSERDHRENSDHGQRLTVLVCRGCCCGTSRKHPDLDHDTQLAELGAAVESIGGRLRVTDCLGPCERSNVVVLRGRGAAGDTTTVWLGDVLDPVTTSALVERLSCWTGDPSALTTLAGEMAFHPSDEPRHCLALAAFDEPSGDAE